MKIKIELESFQGYIDFDGSQFVPTKTSFTKEGKPKKRELGFYTKLEGAIKRIVFEVMGNSADELTLSQFLIKYQSLVNQLESLVNIEA